MDKETCELVLDTKQHVAVHVGDSALTNDLVWCECGRGISVNGKWVYCPNCGGKIDQSSYEQASALAIHRGCNRYRDTTDAEENIRLRAELERIALQLSETEKRLNATQCEAMNLRAELRHYRWRPITEIHEAGNRARPTTPGLTGGRGKL
jgi:hypothetical protein